MPQHTKYYVFIEDIGNCVFFLFFAFNLVLDVETNLDSIAVSIFVVVEVLFFMDWIGLSFNLEGCINLFGICSSEMTYNLTLCGR